MISNNVTNKYGNEVRVGYKADTCLARNYNTHYNDYNEYCVLATIIILIIPIIIIIFIISDVFAIILLWSWSLKYVSLRILYYRSLEN